MPDAFPHPTAARTCAGCELCCTVMAVRELQKAAFSPCAHLTTAGRGCAIWGEHPAACRVFHCLWRSSDVLLPSDFFPGGSGFLLAAEVTEAWPMVVKVCADPARPSAWDTPRNRDIFLRLAAAWNCPVVVIGEGVIASHVFAPSGRDYARAARPDIFPQDGAGLALPETDYGPDRRPPREVMDSAGFSWRTGPVPLIPAKAGTQAF